MKISRRKMAPGVPAVAMADIAFNLVLFFIMMAKTQDDSHLEWTPASTPVVQKTPNSKVSVVVDKQQKLYVNGEQIGIAQAARRRSKKNCKTCRPASARCC